MGYTRQLGQLAYLITYDGSGNITVPASLTQGSVTSSMLKADAGGKLVAAVAGTDFVAPAGLSAYVPTTRTITINGTAYDLSADRSWSIVSGVSSFNTRTGAIELGDTDVTGALGYTPVTNARTLTINGTTYDLSADRSWSIVAGLSSFNTRTGAITLLDTDVTGALGYTPVTNARTITINGTTYDLSANRTWVVDASSVTTRVIQKFTATSNQTAFTITGGYTVGMVDVFLNGIKLDNAVDFTATDGSVVTLAVGAATGDIVEVYKYGGQFIANNTLRQSTLFTATAGQTTFTVNYSVGFVDVFYNGSKLDSSEFTATNGTSIVLGTACVLNDKVEVIAYNYTVGAFTGVGGSGTTNYVSKWTASGTLGNTIIYDDGTNLGIGTTSPSYKLDINGTLRITGTSTLSILNIGNDLNINKADNDSVYSGGQVWLSGTYTSIRSGTDHSFNIDTYNNGGGNQKNTFKILQNGNVGISNSSPRTQLDVGGCIMTLYQTSTLANKASGLMCQNGSSITSAFGLGIQDGIYFQGSDDGFNYKFSIRGSTTNGSLGTENAYITSTGNSYFAGRMQRAGQPSFQAHRANGGNLNISGTDSVGTPINFDVSIYNIGSHYNTSNGRFTAPVAGRYHFSSTCRFDGSTASTYIRLFFTINGSSGSTVNYGYGHVIAGPGGYSSNYHSLTVAATLSLNTGDYVEVRGIIATGSTGIHYESQFSGFLI